MCTLCVCQCGFVCERECVLTAPLWLWLWCVCVCVCPPSPGQDNDYRFTVEVSEGAGGVRVCVRFLAGLNRTKVSFHVVADAIEADVRRVNRAWRRRLAKADASVTAEE